MDQDGGFHQWRWQSEPSGARPPSTGMGPFLFSKGKTRPCNEVWSVRTAGMQKPNVGGDHSFLYFSFMSPTKKNTISSFFIFKVSGKSLAVSVVGEIQAPTPGPTWWCLCSHRDWFLSFIQKRKWSLSLECFSKVVFSWYNSPWGLWKQAASFHLGMKSLVMNHRIFSYGKNSSLLKDFLVWTAFLSKATVHMPMIMRNVR